MLSAKGTVRTVCARGFCAAMLVSLLTCCGKTNTVGVTQSDRPAVGASSDDMAEIVVTASRSDPSPTG